MSNDETAIIPALGGRHSAEVRQPGVSKLMPGEIDRSRVLVLGGTSGIGKACAQYAANMGLITEATGREHYDIRDYPQLRQHIYELRPTHVVYSVGVNILQWSKLAIRADFHELMAINVWGFIEVMQLLQDLHSETSLLYRPSVVAISSDAARRPMRTSVVYCSTKAALDMAVRVTARELAPSGWRVNAVAPGKVINTRMTAYVDARVRELRGWTQEFAEAYESSSNALGSPATPNEVAQVVMDVLFGPMSLNGAVIDVNGGR